MRVGLIVLPPTEKCDVCNHSVERHFNDGLYCVDCTAFNRSTCRSTLD